MQQLFPGITEVSQSVNFVSVLMMMVLVVEGALFLQQVYLIVNYCEKIKSIS